MTPAATPQGARRADLRIDELDAFRAIACVAIVMLHAYQDSRVTTVFLYEDHPFLDTVLRNLDFGLAMFFALSGFLIFRPFARAALAGAPCPSIRSYLQRRAWRLLPLYVLVIGVVWSLRYSGRTEDWIDLLRHLTFTQLYSNEHIFSIDGPAWSLAVEWHFYLLVAILAPLVCVACARLRTRGARLAVLCAPAIGLIVASLVFKWWAQEVAHFSHDRDYAVYYSALARVDTFAMGMLLAVGIVAWGPRTLNRHAAHGLIAAGLASLGLVFATRLGHPLVNDFFYPLCGIACVLLLAGTMLAPAGSAWRRTLRNRWLLAGGAASYSTYLLHEPLLVQLGHANVLTFKDPATWPLATAALVALSAFAGWYAFRLIELPAMHIGALLAARDSPEPALTQVSPATTPAPGATLAGLVLTTPGGDPVAPAALAGPGGLLVHVTPAPSDGARLAHIEVARADRLLADVAEWRYVAGALGVGVCAVTPGVGANAEAAATRRGVTFPVLVDRDGALGDPGGGEWRTETGERLMQPVTIVADVRGGIAARVTGVERHMERVFEAVRALPAV
jgi:peptidoglycan/LPS O-acetylase OafA/YrhL